MKTKSFFGINMRPQYKALQSREAGATQTARLWLWLGMALFALGCGLTAVGQQTDQLASTYRHQQNMSACESGWGQCSEALLTPDEAARLVEIRHRQNVSACESGWGRCSEASLTPDEAARLVTIRHRQNVSACESGWGRCSEALLTPDEAARLVTIRHRQNVSACESGWGRCSEALLTPDEAARLVAIRHRQNVSACESGWGQCNEALLTTGEITHLALVRGRQNVPSQGASAPVAENGSYYGEPNQNGVPKTVLVRGYTKSNGTYVQGYYRSAPGTNPLK